VQKVDLDLKKKELKLSLKNKKFTFVIDPPQLEEIHSLVEKVVNSLSKSNVDDDDSPAQSKASLKRASTRTLTETAATLTKEDWNILAKGFKLITYTRNEPIVEQSVAHQRIYQVAKGKCRIELKADEGQKVRRMRWSRALLTWRLLLLALLSGGRNDDDWIFVW